MQSVKIDSLPIHARDKILLKNELKSSEITIPKSLSEYLNNNSISWNLIINPALISEKLIDPFHFSEKYLKMNLRFRYLALSTFDNARFLFAVMYRTILRFSKTKNSSFQESDLTEVDFKFSKHFNTSFSRSRLYKADLQGARFHNCDFRGTNLQEADIRNAEFKNCKFDNHTNLHGVITNADTSIPKNLSLYPLKFENTTHVTIRDRDVLIHKDPISKEYTVWQRKVAKCIKDHPFKMTWIGNTEHYGLVQDDFANSVLVLLNLQ